MEYDLIKTYELKKKINKAFLIFISLCLGTALILTYVGINAVKAMHYRTVYNRLLPWTLYIIMVFSVLFEQQWQKMCWIVLKSDPAASLELDSLVQPPREINRVLTPITLFSLRFLKGLLQSSASFRRKLKISFHKIFILTVFLQNLPFNIKALPQLLRMKYLHC